ncbi:MAG TPA: IS66 family transposase, partial [Beijerinckiaceae bacterium]|nr:IS66 family transposase [Beijerinckiaceae bacterium]
KSPIAETAVRHIAALYAIEADVRGQPPDASKRSADPLLFCRRRLCEEALRLTRGLTWEETSKWAPN